MITKKLMDELRWTAEEKGRELTITTKDAQTILCALWDTAWESVKKKGKKKECV